MPELSKLSPAPLWQLFSKICSIPHPSKHEEALAEYIVHWAKERALFVERDAIGNILIRKPATHGMEKIKPVVLQAHLDMVPQKNANIQHDFTKDPILAYVDDGWVKAKDTTLGADNGIGMASALAVLDDHSIIHGPIEVLLTMTEETGMDGAFALQPNWLQGEILINTDSEQEGEIYMGCAGGINAASTLPLTREVLPANYKKFSLCIKGLSGGHSGVDIHLGLGNANKLLARFLFTHSQDLDLRITALNGGSLRNAIPREASANIAIPIDKVALLTSLCEDYLATLKHELSVVEKNITIQLLPNNSQISPLCIDSQTRLLSLLNAIPNGVIRMSDEIKGVVETSLNVGVVRMDDKQVEIICLIRSLLDSGKNYVIETIQSIAQLAGATVEAKGNYPGWEPDLESFLMQLVSQTYQKLFNTKPDIKVIHAGLECGLFKKPYPNMDMVSIGPTIKSPHSPDEKVNISSVARYWQLLTTLLKSIPERR